MAAVLGRLVPTSAAVLLTMGGITSVVSAVPADAAQCPPATIGGKTIGWVETGDVKVPLKRVSYPSGGTLDPPASNKVAGVSTRHQPLLADQGTTVIAWHVRYGAGCQGTLNPILSLSAGETFDIVKANGQRRTYKLTTRTKVARGQYKADWFRTHGDPQVTLFTCSDLTNGKFQKTSVLVAEPVTD